MTAERRRTTTKRRTYPDPEEAHQWQRIILESAIVVVALGLLIWQGAFVANPSALIVGAALTMLTVIPTARLEERFRRGKNGDS